MAAEPQEEPQAFPSPTAKAVSFSSVNQDGLPLKRVKPDVEEEVEEEEDENVQKFKRRADAPEFRRQDASYHIDQVGPDITISFALIAFVAIVSLLVGLATVANFQSMSKFGSMVGVNHPETTPDNFYILNYFATFYVRENRGFNAQQADAVHYTIASEVPDVIPVGTTYTKNESDVGLTVEVFFLCYMMLGAIFLTFLYMWLRKMFPVTYRTLKGGGMVAVKQTLAKGSFMTWKAVLFRILLTTVLMGTGFPLGVEGPSVQIGVALCTQIAIWLHITNADIMTMVAFIGASAGVSAAFNTPIAGITFALEEFMHQMHVNVINILSIGSVTSCIMVRVLIGNMQLFSLQHSEELHPQRGSVINDDYMRELAVVFQTVEVLVQAVVVGLFCGIWMAISTHAIVFIRRWSRDHIPVELHMILCALIAGGMCAACYKIGDTLGVYGMGTELIQDSMINDFSELQYLGIFIMKTIAYIFCAGFNAPGGLLSPAIVIGAMIGGCVGKCTNLWFGDAWPVDTAIVFGMGAGFAGMFRIPITALIMVYELTGFYSLILPAMLANFIATYAASWIVKLQIYDDMIYEDNLWHRRHHHDHHHRHHHHNHVELATSLLGEHHLHKKSKEHKDDEDREGAPIRASSSRFSSNISDTVLRLSDSIKQQVGKDSLGVRLSKSLNSMSVAVSSNFHDFYESEDEGPEVEKSEKSGDRPKPMELDDIQFTTKPLSPSSREVSFSREVSQIPSREASGIPSREISFISRLSELTPEEGLSLAAWRKKIGKKVTETLGGSVVPGNMDSVSAHVFSGFEVARSKEAALEKFEDLPESKNPR